MKQTLTVDEIARSSDHVTVDGMLKAIDTYNRFHSLFADVARQQYEKFLKSHEGEPRDGSTTGQARYEGYEAGLKSGFCVGQVAVDGVTLDQIIKALYG